MESQSNTQVPSSTENTGIVGSIVHMAEQVVESAVHLKDNVAETAGLVSHKVMEEGQIVSEAVTSTITKVETAAEDFAHNIKEQVTGTLLSAQEKIFGTTDTNEIKEEVKEKAAEMGTNAQIKTSDIKESVKQTAAAAQSNISTQASVVSGTVSETAQNLKEAVVHKAEQVVEQAQHTMETLKDTAGQKLEGAKSYVASSVPSVEGVKKTVGQAKEFVAEKAPAMPAMNVEGMKKTAGQTYEQAKEFVTEKVGQAQEKVPVGVRMSAGQTFEQAKGYVSDISTAAQQKLEQAKEFVAEKAPAMPSMNIEEMKKTAGQTFEQAKEFVSEKVGQVQDKIPSTSSKPLVAEVVVEDLNTIPLPVEVTLVAKDNVVVAESLPSFTESSVGNEGGWEEVKNYHTIVQENKAEKQDTIPPAPIVEKPAEPVKLVPVDDSALPQTEGAVWPAADNIKLSNETAWTNPQKTLEIVQNLTQENSAVLAEERK